MKKKLFVISDIHGHYTLMKKALDQAGFCENNSEHLLVCLGDMIDRGSESLQVMRYLDKLENKVLLRGNHEDMFIKLLHTGRIEPHHRINGTVATLLSLFGKSVFDLSADTLDFSAVNTREFDWVCEFLEKKNNLLDYFETKNYVFTHGFVPTGCKTSEQLPAYSAETWQQARIKKWIDCYKKGVAPLQDKCLVVGHVPTFYSSHVDPDWPKNCTGIYYGKGFIAIDAGTYDTGKVNVLIIEDELL